MVNMSAAKTKPGAPTNRNVMCQGSSAPTIGQCIGPRVFSHLTTRPPPRKARPDPRYGPAMNRLIARPCPLRSQYYMMIETETDMTATSTQTQQQNPQNKKG